MTRGAVALALAAATLAWPAGPARAASWSEGACTDPEGVTVVVDFQELGGGTNVRCAPGPVATGLDALTRAGISWEGTRRFAGVVCRIAGRPGPETETCGNTPPASAYWAYWMAPRGGTWCYAGVGPGNRTPPPGTVEGWSFALGKASTAVPPPGIAPPEPLPGQTTPSVVGCSTPQTGDGATTTAPPATTTPATVPAAAATAAPTTPAPDPGADDDTGASGGDAGGAGAGGDPAPVAGGTDAGATTTIATTIPASSGPVTSAAASSAPPAPGAAAAPSAVASTSTSASAATSTSTATTSGSAPAGGSTPATVDLGDDGRGDGGLSAFTVGVVAVAAALAAAGAWYVRRRRAGVW